MWNERYPRIPWKSSEAINQEVESFVLNFKIVCTGSSNGGMLHNGRTLYPVGDTKRTHKHTYTCCTHTT